MKLGQLGQRESNDDSAVLSSSDVMSSESGGEQDTTSSSDEDTSCSSDEDFVSDEEALVTVLPHKYGWWSAGTYNRWKVAVANDCCFSVCLEAGLPAMEAAAMRQDLSRDLRVVAGLIPPQALRQIAAA